MDAAVVEFDPLADSIRASSEDENLWFLGWAGFVVFHIVGGVVVGGIGLKFSRAGIHQAIGGMNLHLFAPCPNGAGSGHQLLGGSWKDSGKVDIRQTCLSGLKEKWKEGRVSEPTLFFHRLGNFCNLFQVIQEPGVDFCNFVDSFDRPSLVEGVADIPNSGWMRCAKLNG